MGRRFDWVVAGSTSGPDAVCDHPVFSDSRSVIAPSLGSLVPGWLLVIPKRQALSYAELTTGERSNILCTSRKFAATLNSFAPAVFILEHGPRAAGSAMGCGVDQAHLHLVPMASDFTDAVFEDSEGVKWARADRDDPWAEILPGAEYYLMSSEQGTFVGYPNATESQFFRKKIAQSIGKPETWNYREWPNYDNAYRTLEHFGISPGQRRAA